MSRPAINNKFLANQALRTATKVRSDLKLDQYEPLCIYDVCDKIGVSVRFIDISMDGMYNKSNHPKILISSQRPLVRRNMTCAHELGHHIFGHSSTIDELNSIQSKKSYENPIEYLADRFASSLLLPTLGIRKAVNLRCGSGDKITKKNLMAVAGDYKVGLAALISHLYFSLNILTYSQYKEFKKISPAKLRQNALGYKTPKRAVFIDHNSCLKTLDIETDTIIISQHKIHSKQDLLKPLGQVPYGYSYAVEKQGLERAEILESGHAFFIRSSKCSSKGGYVGLAKYRHLDEVYDEQSN